MDKKDNMKQAMFELFGVGKGSEGEQAAYPDVEQEDLVSKEAFDTPAPPPERGDPFGDLPAPKPAVSFLAEGTSFEGSLSAKGDVEIAGEFKGSIATEGSVRLYSDIQSDITAKNVELFGCVLTGEIAAGSAVSVDESSRVVGDISARDLLCSGEINGDLTVSKTTRIQSKARVKGNIVTGGLDVEMGAVLSGNVQVTGFSEVIS